jgi:hypothetical protein
MFALIQQPKVAERYPALYMRAADAGPHTFDFYKAALTREKSTLRPLVPLAICRLGRHDAEVVAELKRQFLEEKQGARQAKDEILVALVKLHEEAFLRDNISTLPSRQQGWANAILAGEGETETGPNNCMGERWGFTSYLTPEMGPTLRLRGGVWKRGADT